ncbi:hypothetical protein CF326_g7934 [Tilletia indica]|nr:hypothetical protein CF326_g7934 [Tilletia indica]
MGTPSISTPKNGSMGPPGAPMGSRTPYGGGLAQDVGKPTSSPAAGFGRARTPFGAKMGNDGGITPFQAPRGVTFFAEPGRGFGGATPTATAAAYGGATPNWSAGNKTPARQQAQTRWGQGASGAATPFHAGGGGRRSGSTSRLRGGRRSST